VLPALIIIPSPGGDLASTGLMKELQRVQVQVPGKTSGMIQLPTLNWQWLRKLS